MTEAPDEYIQRCFRHQHPEAYGHDPILSPKVLGITVSEEHLSTPWRLGSLGPIEQGHPDAKPLPPRSGEVWDELVRAREGRA